MKLNRFLALAVTALLGGSLLGAVPADTVPNPSAGEPRIADSYPGNTRPSDRRQLSLKTMDAIWEVKVERGDHVKKGQPLIVEDRREEELNLQIIKVEAESQASVKGAEVAVKAAEVTLQNKQVEFQRIEKMYNQHVANVEEYDKAKLDVQISELEIQKAKWDMEKAKIEHDQRVLQLQRQGAVLDRMQILSPFDGIVEEVLQRAGEVVDPQKPSIIVVKNDPLWVDVYLPTSITLNMKLGQQLPVKYDFEAKPRMGTVKYLNPVADAGAGMRMVTLELPNPDSVLPAGIQVSVTPPDAKAGPVASGK